MQENGPAPTQTGISVNSGKHSSPSPTIWLMLAVPPLLWAGNFAVGRAASAEVPPMMLAFARQLIALVVLLPFGWSVMKRDMGRYWEWRWQILKTSLSGVVVFNALVYSGLHTTTASNAQLMNSAIPVLIILFGSVFLRQSLTRQQIFGLLLSCVGVLTIILHGDFARLIALKFSYGDLIVFLAMVSFSLFSVWLRSFPADIDRLGLLGAQFVVAVVVLLPFVVWEYMSGLRASWSTGGIAAMVYVGIAAGFLANLFYMFGIARVGPARAGLFIHLVPLYGVIISSMFLGEKLYPYHAAGMVAIIAGLALSQSGGHKESRRPAAQTIVYEDR